MNIDDAYHYCIKLLSIKDRTSAELVTKLKKKHFSEELIKETLSKLKSRGYIDDEKYIQQWIKDKSKKPGVSKKYMYNKLLEKGFNKDVINIYFEKLDINDFYTAYDCGKKKIKTLKGDTKTKVNKLFLFLLRRGYDYDTCNKVIRELLSENQMNYDIELFNE